MGERTELEARIIALYVEHTRLHYALKHAREDYRAMGANPQEVHDLAVECANTSLARMESDTDGWTREWPTEPGWWWVWPKSYEVPEPAYLWTNADGDWLASVINPKHARTRALGDSWSKSLSVRARIRIWFHPMEQPPAPPEDEE